MLSNRSFRTKLALVVLPALLVLGLLAAMVIQPRLTEASEADVSLTDARIATSNMQYRDEVRSSWP